MFHNQYIIFSCELINGSYVPEGEFVKIDGDSVPKTSEVVFIVEAKQCNQNITSVKSIATLVTLINTELENAGLKNNR